MLVEVNGQFYVDGGNFRLVVPQTLGGISRVRINRQVVFGIRPEHINDLAFVMPARGVQELDALVEVIEPIGSEVILIVTAGGHQFAAKVHPQTKASLHQSIKLSIDMNRMHLFDKETGEKIDLE
jgi:multiple sugar transport system ATP-binding protein